MKNNILLFILCCSHVVLATTGYLSLYIALSVSVVVGVIAVKRLHFVLDWSVLVHMCFIAAYVLNGAALQNIVLLVGAAGLLIYQSNKQQQLQQYAFVQHEVDKKLADFNETFQKVRQERHDYLKHVAAISYLLEDEQVGEAKSYMQRLVKQYEETNLSIKGEQGAVASVLHTNYEKARASGIAINYLLEVPVSNLAMPADEIVQLLGNMLENAIDACEAWQQQHDEQAFIELSLRKKSGLYILTCINSTQPLPNDIADQLFTKSSVTTKANHSGLGTSIIQQIVDKHNGYLEFMAEKQTFTLVCKLPNVVGQ